MADLFKACQCGHRNSADLFVCEKCGADLTYAQEVYGDEQAAPISAPVSRGHSGADVVEYCKCPVSQPDSEDPPGCWACDLPIAAGSAPCEPAVPGQVVIVLPGNVKVDVGPGLLLGRDVRMASAPLRNLMSAYPGLSRCHVWVGCDGHEVTIIDLGSKNGTWLDDKKLEPCVPFTFPLTEVCMQLRLGQQFVSLLQPESLK